MISAKTVSTLLAIVYLPCCAWLLTSIYLFKTVVCKLCVRVAVPTALAFLDGSIEANIG